LRGEIDRINHSSLTKTMDDDASVRSQSLPSSRDGDTAGLTATLDNDGASSSDGDMHQGEPAPLGGVPRIRLKCRTVEEANGETGNQERQKEGYEDVLVSVDRELEKVRARKAVVETLLGSARLPDVDYGDDESAFPLHTHSNGGLVQLQHMTHQQSGLSSHGGGQLEYQPHALGIPVSVSQQDPTTQQQQQGEPQTQQQQGGGDASVMRSCKANDNKDVDQRTSE